MEKVNLLNDQFTHSYSKYSKNLNKELYRNITFLFKGNGTKCSSCPNNEKFYEFSVCSNKLIPDLTQVGAVKKRKDSGEYTYTDWNGYKFIFLRYKINFLTKF